MGSPTVVADLISPGPHSQIAARLARRRPRDRQRDARRPRRSTGRPDARPRSGQVFQLHPERLPLRRRPHRQSSSCCPRRRPLQPQPSERPAADHASPTSSCGCRCSRSPGIGRGRRSRRRRSFPPATSSLPTTRAPIDSDGDGIADPDRRLPAQARAQPPTTAAQSPIPTATATGSPTPPTPVHRSRPRQQRLPRRPTATATHPRLHDHCPHSPAPPPTTAARARPTRRVASAPRSLPDEPGPIGNDGCPPPMRTASVPVASDDRLQLAASLRAIAAVAAATATAPSLGRRLPLALRPGLLFGCSKERPFAAARSTAAAATTSSTGCRPRADQGSRWRRRLKGPGVSLVGRPRPDQRGAASTSSLAASGATGSARVTASATSFAAAGPPLIADRKESCARRRAGQRSSAAASGRWAQVSSASALSTSLSCCLGCTLGKTRATLPSGSSRKVERCTPMYLLPYMLFSTQVPYRSATA